MNSNTLPAKAMRLAHQIKDLFSSFSQALKAAWQIAKLAAGFSINITFAKDTGEVRNAHAIACGGLSTIEKGFVRFVEQLEEGRTQWRSFRIERLIV